MTESVIFMKAAGVTGESMNAAYKQWTDCRSVSFDLQNSRRHGSQGPSNSTAGDVVCMALVDNACTALTQKCASGANIPKVEFAFVKMGEQQVEYMRYTIEDVYVTGVQLAGASESAGGHPVVSYSFNFAKLTLDYKQQTSRGSPGGGSTATWDIKQNKP